MLARSAGARGLGPPMSDELELQKLLGDEPVMTSNRGLFFGTPEPFLFFWGEARRTRPVTALPNG